MYCNNYLPTIYFPRSLNAINPSNTLFIHNSLLLLSKPIIPKLFLLQYTQQYIYNTFYYPLCQVILSSQFTTISLQNILISLSHSLSKMAPTVCVMDASGELGSTLVERLLQRGYTVHAVVQSQGIYIYMCVCVCVCVYY